MAGAKIIDGDSDIHVGQLGKLLTSVIHIAHQPRLGHFQGQETLGNLLLLKASKQLLGKVLTAQLTSGHIHRNMKIVVEQPLCSPGADIADGVIQHPIAYAENITAGLGQRNKFTGGDKSKLRMLPA